MSLGTQNCVFEKNEGVWRIQFWVCLDIYGGYSTSQWECPVGCELDMGGSSIEFSRKIQSFGVMSVGPPSPQNLSIKSCVFILIYLNFRHLQSTLHLMQYTYIEMSFPLLKTVFELVDFDALVLLLFFCFTSSTSAKHFYLGTFFIWGNKKKSQSWWDQVNRGRALGVMPFLVKNCGTLSMVWAGALLNHPSWNGQTCWKSLQKKITEAECSLSQQCQMVHWYRWVHRTLT